jgi:hypothetical protein
MTRKTFRLTDILCSAVAALLVSPACTLAADTKDLRLDPGWVVVGRQHVRDNAEKDLAVLDADKPLMKIRVCATENSIRLRNATAWLPRDERQKLWLPLILEAGKCSDPIDVKGAPERVTHIALEYEAMGADWGGAHLVIAGLPAREAR